MSSEPECQVCGDYIYHGHVICKTCYDKKITLLKNYIDTRHNSSCKLYHDTLPYLSQGNVYEAQRFLLEDIIKFMEDNHIG